MLHAFSWKVMDCSYTEAQVASLLATLAIVERLLWSMFSGKMTASEDITARELMSLLPGPKSTSTSCTPYTKALACTEQGKFSS